jgi:hypothetical protein
MPHLTRQVFGSTAATEMMLALRGALVEPLLVTMPEVVSRMRPEVVRRFRIRSSRSVFVYTAHPCDGWRCEPPVHHPRALLRHAGGCGLDEPGVGGV